MSVPQPRRAREHERASRARTNRPLVREPDRADSWPAIFRIRKVRKSHRLTWFGAAQGLLLLGFAMFGSNYRWLSAAFIGTGIALCLPAITVACVTGRIHKPLHLVLATAWAIAGSIFVLANSG